MLATILVFGRGIEHHGYRPVSYGAILLCLLLLIGLLAWSGSRLRQTTGRGLRVLFTLLALPTVFSSLALVLPMLHPEPFEWTWIAVDRSWFGVDPTVSLQALLSPWAVEVMQWCYGVFYFIPILVLVVLYLRRSPAVFDRGLNAIVFGFLLSYLGYVLWPTLPPYRFLHHDVPLHGVFAAGWINTMLYEAEANRWDCFPSGHTMLSLMSLHLAFRHVPKLALWLLPVVLILVFSTVALRYHYVVDVAAGVVLVPVAFWLVGRFDRPDPHEPVELPAA